MINIQVTQKHYSRKIIGGKNMKKNIIITSGPTNERIDAVMKITNMSTGALGAIVADTFLEEKMRK